MRFNRIIAAAVALTALLAVLTGLFAYTYLGAGERSRFWVNHTRDVIERNQTLFSLVRDAETDERGYLISEQAQYLRPFRDAEAKVPGTGARLAALVADNGAEAARVGELNRTVSRRLARLDASVALGEAGDFEGARDIMRRGDGQQLMDLIRRQSQAVSNVEQALLERRTAQAVGARQLNLLIGLTLAVLALVGLVSLVFILVRANRRLARAMDEARAAQAAREASEALVQAVFANAPDYLFVLDVEDGDRFVVGDVNPAFEKALRVSAADIRGRLITELMAPSVAEPLLAHYRRVLAAGKPVLTRDVLPDTPAGPRTWESILSPVQNADGRTGRIVGSIRDITSRVKTEERLREAQRMEAVGHLTGGLAHDFNNLLQVIRGNLELLEPAVEGDAVARRRLANAVHGADRAAQLTRQLLAFARRQPLEPRVINLSRLMGDMTDLLRRTLGEGVQVETVIGGGLWNTLADPAQVESAVLNLALNARDAMPGGGRLTVEVTNAWLDEAYVRHTDGLAPGQYVLIAVSDTGEGMDEETRKRVFEPFFTTKAEGKGSGLGLAMVYGFARQSNGHIQIYSEPGQGTTVKIYLPRSRDSVASATAPSPLPAHGDDQTILVVEDEASVRAAAVSTLEALGYRCLEAPDAEAALALLAAGDKVDLVFSDVVMPGTVKARDFAERLRTTAPDVPILFTSGYTENAIVHHGRLDDGVNLLSKPYARDELARRVAQLLRRATPPQPPESARPG
jgi:PAS domain S-box-containing protein